VNVLVVAPHPDDESIGCGGIVRAHARRGDRVHVAYLTSGERGITRPTREEAWRVREGEALAAAEVLGVASHTFLRLPDYGLSECTGTLARLLASIVAAEEPRLILAPHADEAHPDHRGALTATMCALASHDRAVPVLLYEVWTPLATYDHVEDVSAVMPTKLRAVRCHTSQLQGFRYDTAVRGLNRYRGVMAGRCAYAEVFRLVATYQSRELAGLVADDVAAGGPGRRAHTSAERELLAASPLGGLYAG
jgi:LmbE family N-acetylglucosaminyl deacetylase